MKVLLITGSNGWLGKATLEQITKSKLFGDIQTIILVNLEKIKTDKNDSKIEKYFLENGFRIINLFGNLGKVEIYKSIEKNLISLKIKDLKVIAIASVIHPENYSDFKNVNVNGIKNLYEINKKYNLSKFTYISSNSPFGFNLGKNPFNELSKYSPKGGYGESKCRAEKFLLSQKETNKITILRAPWFHGKNMPERQKKFIRSAAVGKFPLIGLGNNIRSIVDVGDLAQAAINLTFKERKHQIYWVSSEN